MYARVRRQQLKMDELMQYLTVFPQSELLQLDM